MIGYMKYVLRRTLLVLGALAAGLLGWPGDVGAQSLLNAGSIDASGARRIRVEPKAPAPAETEAEETGGTLSRLLGMFGSGEPAEEAATTPNEANDASSASVAPDIQTAAAMADAAPDGGDETAETAVPAAATVTVAQSAGVVATATPELGRALFEAFGATPPKQTPYEVSHAAMIR